MTQMYQCVWRQYRVAWEIYNKGFYHAVLLHIITLCLYHEIHDLLLSVIIHNCQVLHYRVIKSLNSALPQNGILNFVIARSNALVVNFDLH